MQKVQRISVAACLLIALSLCSQGIGATAYAQKGAKKPAADKKEQTAKTRKKARGRLPNYYGQVGLNKQQRDEIYSIQAKFRELIAELEKQLAELRTKQEADIKAVLTDEQTKRLTNLVAEAAKRRASRSKKSGSTSNTPSPDPKK